MKVYKLEIDCAKCFWVGMALVAAESYEAAVREYADNGESGQYLEYGEIVLTEDSRQPISGLTYSEGQAVICDITMYDP